MKKVIVLIVLFLAAHGWSSAQSAFPELDKIKQIKLLESTREDVKRIFSEFEEQFDDEEDGEVQSDPISTENMKIRFHYSLGNCSDDDEEEWNVPKGRVTEISVILEKSVKAKDLKIDLSKFERIKEVEDDETDEEDPDDFIYYDQDKNVSYALSDDEIENIIFMPPEKNFPALCSNETINESVSHKDWLLKKLKNRPSRGISCGFANVDEVFLSRNEITTASCSATEEEESAACLDNAEISVETKATSSDPNDILVYNYTVSGGIIIGEGDKVIWSLNGVKSGKYTITAWVDAGGGLRGTTKTQEIFVRECSNCKQK